MNANELRAEMMRSGINMADMASAFNICRSALYRKMNGKTEFLQSEISIIRRLLHLSDERIMQIFFEQ